MRIACVGGGPGGLFFSLLLKAHRPDWDVVLFERNRATDAFGFGVVFSDATLRAIDAADPILSDALAEFGVHWDAIEVWAKGEKERFAGNGMAAIHRRKLLELLQETAQSRGVEMRFEQFVPSVDDLSEFDVIVGADGANSTLRDRVADRLGHSVDSASAKFIWFGTSFMFDGLTFVHERSADGMFAVHGYPISSDVSTFIVETDEQTWLRAGLDEFDVSSPPGLSDEKSRAYVAELFRGQLGDAELLVNNSRWGNFRTRRTDRWHDGNVVFLGDAMHTAHFSVGSGTKMAMEDAIVLARELAASDGDLEAAFTRYEDERKPAVARIQDAAVPSLAWWERFGHYHDAFDPWQFAFHFFSRSIPIDKVRQRDAAFVDHVESSWETKLGAPVLTTPLSLGNTTVGSRLLRVDGSDLVDPATGTRVSRSAGAEVDATTNELPHGTPAFVVVHGGDAVQRAQRSESLRLDHGLTTIIADPAADAGLAATLVLSGRADAVVAGA